MKLEAAGDLFEILRAVKTEEEIASMVRAQRISEQALEEVLHIIRPGMTEREVAAELVYRMLRHGAEGNSFDPIVVTGPKTSMPHGVPGDEVIRAGDFVTMDFGCLKDGYCSDMTRTVAVGSATEEMKNVYATANTSATASATAWALRSTSRPLPVPAGSSRCRRAPFPRQSRASISPAASACASRT